MRISVFGIADERGKLNDLNVIRRCFLTMMRPYDVHYFRREIPIIQDSCSNSLMRAIIKDFEPGFAGRDVLILHRLLKDVEHFGFEADPCV